MRTKGLTEEWNDENGRTKAEVLARMRQIKMSNDDLEETFGPNWESVIAIIRRAAILTPDEIRRLTAMFIRTATQWTDRHRSAAWYAAYAAALDDMREVALDASTTAARVAARDAAKDYFTVSKDDSAVYRDAAKYAARDAACAVAVADLVGKHGLTKDHIDALMKPWVDVIGGEW